MKQSSVEPFAPSRRDTLRYSVGVAVSLAGGINPFARAHAFNAPSNDNGVPPRPPAGSVLSVPAWPKEAVGQDEVRAFYGDPRGVGGLSSPSWERANLVRVRPSFRMTFAGRTIETIQVHAKCASSLSRILDNIWRQANYDQTTIDHWGASKYGGSYVYRRKRTSLSLSMHAYGCAIDLDPARNGLGDTSPHLTADHPIVRAFESEGWVWGGRWQGRSIDAMHFQATLRRR